MSVEPNDLLLFARVVEAGSFSRAAERVRMPKSTVSRRIAELERRLGERLLLRSTRKLAVTEFGISVLDHARQVADEVDGAMALALHRQAQPSGKLRISMPGDFANMTLSAMLARFVQQHPAIALEVDVSPRRVDLIAESFDVAIRMGALPDDTQLAARRLAEMSMGLYAAPAYLNTHGEPKTPEALEGMHALMIHGGQFARAADPPGTPGRGPHRGERPFRDELCAKRRAGARAARLVPGTRVVLGGVSGAAADAGEDARVPRCADGDARWLRGGGGLRLPRRACRAGAPESRQATGVTRCVGGARHRVLGATLRRLPCSL